MIMRRLLFMAIALALMASGLQAGLVTVTMDAAESCRTHASDPDGNKRAFVLDVRNNNKSWLKFDMAAYIDNYLVEGERNELIEIESAVLKIYLRQDRSGTVNVDVSGINDDVQDNIGWASNDITWNNAPGNDIASGTHLNASKATHIEALTIIEGKAGDLFAIDVKEFLALDTDGIIQFALHDTTGGGALVQFISSTATASNYPDYPDWQPVLEVTYVPEPMTIALLGLGGLVLRKTRKG